MVNFAIAFVQVNKITIGITNQLYDVTGQQSDYAITPRAAF